MPWMWHLESWGLGTGIHWSFRLLWLFLFCFALFHFVLPEVDFAEKLLLFLRRKRQPWELFLLGDSVQRLKSHSKSLRQVVPLEKLAASPEAQGSLWTQQETKREKQNSAVGSRLSEAGRWCRRLRELGASLHGVHLGRLPQPSPTDLHPLVQERQPLVALSVWQPQESTLFLPLWLGGGGVGGGGQAGTLDSDRAARLELKAMEGLPVSPWQTAFWGGCGAFNISLSLRTESAPRRRGNQSLHMNVLTVQAVQVLHTFNPADREASAAK